MSQVLGVRMFPVVNIQSVLNSANYLLLWIIVDLSWIYYGFQLIENIEVYYLYLRVFYF